MQRSDAEIQSLLMGLMDGELSSEEANDVNDILRKNQSWIDEYDSLMEAHQQLKGLSFEEPEDAVLITALGKPLFPFCPRCITLDDSWGLPLPVLLWALGAFCFK